MARTQEFDTTKALGDARLVFWDKGFDATSIADLESATGLGRSSIYHGFGSKRGLFDAVIQDYMDRVLRPRLGLLHSTTHPDGGISTYLKSLADALAKAPDETTNRGCLLLNTAAGIAGNDDALRVLIYGYQIELRDGVAAALRAADRGQAEPLVLARARIVTGLTMSALLLARLDLAEALATLEAAEEQVRQWLAAGGTPPR
ncbi:TetR/AcrR family transcriptional regulator [Paeniglutamicibacter psychrophenolicus]|uniref:TetR/AcrR family transcriptional regulator n=1 Tax=Paeniglutamicibacter psychrophenolicus TaxID=257454 RepID=UPI002788F09B|nr:TetR/AcrR family transcriptional regulator [Paeniglutamicibacter psychrophenolicus]MDQ0093373.1 AcrR family transcriptional regulator [Paeniglutamicibacter psychrophenolicus]